MNSATVKPVSKGNKDVKPAKSPAVLTGEEIAALVSQFDAESWDQADEDVAIAKPAGPAATA